MLLDILTRFTIAAAVRSRAGCAGNGVEESTVTIRQQEPSLEEFLQWPEQKPYLEYIHGRVRPKARPDSAHSRVQSTLAAMLYPWSEANQGWAQTEQRCILDAGGETHTVLPHVAWWSREQYASLPEGSLRIAPVLAVEILSPDDRYGEVQDKVTVYIKAGVSVVWVVDPGSRNVAVYRPGQPLEMVAPPSMLQDKALSGLSIPLAEVFSRLPTRDDPRLQK